MSERAERLIEEYETLSGERAGLNRLWEEIAEVLAPERVGFAGAGGGPGGRSQKIFDTAPLVAKRGLVNAIGSMLRPKSSAPGKWFDIVPGDARLLDDRAVKEWLELAEQRLWEALYNPRAQFIQATGEVDDDLVTFGTGVGYVGLNEARSGLHFKSFHLKNVHLTVDADNSPTGVIVTERLTPAQAAGRWGADKIGPTAREALLSDDAAARHKKVEFLWKVAKRAAPERGNPSNKAMAYESLVVALEDKHEVEEQGFNEFPFFVPRWDTRSGEVYGRGPGVLALPDVLSLNQMGKTMLRALHRAVDPPWLLPSDSMINAPQIRPGGVSYYDAKAIRDLGLTQPFQQMDTRGNIPWGLDAQARAREQVFAVFFRNVLNLPVDAPKMTATEVMQRREEFVREVGAVFGRLESDYTGPIVERAFRVLMRRGAFGGPGEIPEVLSRGGVGFRFASPIEKAKRQIEEGTVTGAIEKVLQIGQIQPEVMQPYDWTEVGKFIGQSNDFPAGLFLDEEALAARREAAAESARAQELLDGMDQGAGAVGKLAAAMGTGGAP